MIAAHEARYIALFDYSRTPAVFDYDPRQMTFSFREPRFKGAQARLIRASFQSAVKRVIESLLGERFEQVVAGVLFEGANGEFVIGGFEDDLKGSLLELL